MIPRLVRSACRRASRNSRESPACAQQATLSWNDAGDAGGARRVAQTMMHRIVENGAVGVGQAPLRKRKGSSRAAALALEAVGREVCTAIWEAISPWDDRPSVGNHHQQASRE